MRSRSDGAALLMALLTVMLMLALGTALILTTMTETRIAAGYRSGLETFYAADAGIERVLDDLRAAPDWKSLPSSQAMSAFVDGQPGARTLGDGSSINLTRETTTVQGGNEPAWRLFAYGALASLLAPAELDSRAYVVVWIAEAPEEHEGESVAVLSQAYGPQGVRRAVQAVVVRGGPNPAGAGGAVRVLSWRERL